MFFDEVLVTEALTDNLDGLFAIECFVECAFKCELLPVVTTEQVSLFRVEVVVLVHLGVTDNGVAVLVISPQCDDTFLFAPI